MLQRWISPVIDLPRVARGLRGYGWFLRNYLRYRRMEGAEPIRLSDAYPQIHDKVEKSPYDAHYFYQDNWALRRIKENAPQLHVDVGSRVDTVSHNAVHTPTLFVDIRPLEARVEGLDTMGGHILRLPFRDDSVTSLSCLHVAEHIGLGRYGDPLDPHGSQRAAEELARVLAPGGNLYFSGPTGQERLVYNAHRVHAPETILRYFDGLDLQEFSAIDDVGTFHRRADLKVLEGADYGCGLFWFRKPEA